MKTTIRLLTITGLTAAALSQNAQAQRPRGGQNAQGAGDLVSRMLQFDTNQDGSVARSELTDARLQRLFVRADADQDGLVTREELTALASAEPQGGGGFGGGMTGMPRPGEILPAMVRQRLQLTAEQSARIDAIQKEVDAELANILTAEQQAALQQAPQMGPGGPPGGPFGPGGPGGQFGPGGPFGQGVQGDASGRGGQGGPGGRGRPPGGPGGNGPQGGRPPR